VGTFQEVGTRQPKGLGTAFRGTIIKMGKRVGEVVTTNPLEMLAKFSETNKIRRNITISIKSGHSLALIPYILICLFIVGMKRYVDILASHHVYNKTDENLDMQLTGEGFIFNYTCPPGKRTPICYFKDWDMTMKIRPSQEWNWSVPLNLDLKVS